MSFFDELNKFISPNPTSPWSRFFTPERYAGAIQAERKNIESAGQVNVIKAQAEANALSKGYTLEQGLFGTTTRAGSPQSGLAQNQGFNFLDVLKWNAQNAPTAFQEVGKEKSTSLTVNTPEGFSRTVQTPSGSITEQRAGSPVPKESSLSGWIPIIIVIGIVLIVILMIKRK